MSISRYIAVADARRARGLALAGAQVPPAEAGVAVRREWPHAELGREGEARTVVLLGDVECDRVEP